MTVIPPDIALSRQQPSAFTGFLSGVWRLIRKQPVGAVCAIFLLFVVVVAVTAPVIAPYNPNKFVSKRLDKPGPKFLLGTDSVGRDVLSRVIYGAQISLMAGVISVSLATVVGAAVGITSGYFGGKYDLFVQRVVDAFMSFPPLLLAMLLVALLGPNLRNAMIAIAFGIMPYQSRVIRSTVLSLKQEQYIEAARALGASPLRVIFQHILPNIAPVIIILASLQVAGAITAEAALSFLGLGTQPPTASWGEMLSGPGRTHMETAPWIVLGPGVAISLTVLAFTLLGDTVRDVLAPRLRGSR